MSNLNLLRRVKINIIGVIIVPLILLSCNINDSNLKKKINHNSTFPELEQFGQFVGEWECRTMNLQRDSTWQEGTASWKFEYILDGNAVQDYWKNPALSNNDSVRPLLGTNIRIYNPSLKEWQCIWLENRRNTMNGIWYASIDENKDIIMKDSTNNWEIKFYNITKDRFDWKWDFKQPSGEMRTMSKIIALRKS